jgi:hypothetical protein
VPAGGLAEPRLAAVDYPLDSYGLLDSYLLPVREGFEVPTPVLVTSQSASVVCRFDFGAGQQSASLHSSKPLLVAPFVLSSCSAIRSRNILGTDA